MRILVLFVTMRQVVKKDHKDIPPEKFVKIAKGHKWKLKGKRFQRQGEGDLSFVGEVDQSQYNIYEQLNRINYGHLLQIFQFKILNPYLKFQL